MWARTASSNRRDGAIWPPIDPMSALMMLRVSFMPRAFAEIPMQSREWRNPIPIRRAAAGELDPERGRVTAAQFSQQPGAGALLLAPARHRAQWTRSRFWSRL